MEFKIEVGIPMPEVIRRRPGEDRDVSGFPIGGSVGKLKRNEANKLQALLRKAFPSDVIAQRTERDKDGNPIYLDTEKKHISCRVWRIRELGRDEK